MPIFDFKAIAATCYQSELFITTRIFLNLWKKMRKLPSGMLSGFPEFGLTLTNVEEKPVHFSSKKQLLEYKEA